MIGAQTRTRVRERAHNACEYCLLHQNDSPLAALHVEHIIPKTHGGSDDLDNLALACIDCNLHKGTNLTGIDPQTSKITELFHPRRQLWDEHFELQGVYLAGKTAIGRTTIRVLNMNSEDQVALRSSE
jgi:5-methylcytosine-specific restriction endonuclease McrA